MSLEASQNAGETQAVWVRNGWLVEHETSRRETKDLLAVVERDLRDCRTPGLSPDWRLNIAYNAALQAATAALAASGYRAERRAHHYRVIQSLSFTIGADGEMVRQLDQFRKKRNLGEYERSGFVSEQEVKEMINLATRLKLRVVDWLRQKHPMMTRA